MAEWSNAAVLKTVDLHGSSVLVEKKSLRISASSLNSQFSILNLLGDIDLVDLGLSAGGTGEEVLGSDDGGAFITLDLLYPELHG